MSAPAQAAGPADNSGLRSARHERLRLLLRSATFLAGMVIVLFWVGCALFGTRLVPDDPYSGDLLNTLAPPSADNWFGTDQLGRDVFSRVIVGARDILTRSKISHKAYDCSSCLNRKHMLWAWCSLFTVGFTDVYIRLCSMGIWHDWRIL